MARKLSSIAAFRGIASTFAGLIRGSLKALIEKALRAAGLSSVQRQEIAAELDKSEPETSFVASIINNINSRHKATLANKLKNEIGINVAGWTLDKDINDYLSAKIAENVGLVRNVSTETRNKLVALIYRSLTDESINLRDEILKVKGFSDSRARLIARDQTSKIQSQLHAKRLKNIGVTEYTWRTSKDERVRDSHKSKEGKRFRFDDPPSDTGNPGDDINCRCTVEAVIELDVINRFKP